MESRIQTCIQNRNIYTHRGSNINKSLWPSTFNYGVTHDYAVRDLHLAESKHCTSCGNHDNSMFDTINLEGDSGIGDPFAEIKQCKKCSTLLGVDDSLSPEDIEIKLDSQLRAYQTLPSTRLPGIRDCTNCGNRNDDLFYEITLDEGNDYLPPMTLYQCAVCSKVVENDSVDHGLETQSLYQTRGELDVNHLNHIVGALNSCVACGNDDNTRFHTITLDENRHGFDPLAMRQCMECLSLHGADDSMTQQEAMSWIQSLPVDICECGNTDASAYIFRQKGGIKHLECQNCFNDIELKTTEISIPEDATEKMPKPEDESEKQFLLNTIAKTKVVAKMPISSLNELRVGDHITWWKVAYWHHALVKEIHSDNDVTVIHYSAFGSNNPFNKAKIQEERMDLKDQSGILYKVIYDGPCLSPEQAISRAEQRKGEEKYNILTANCEHFITWCKVGDARCSQVKEAVKTTVTATHKVANNAAIKALKFLAPTVADDLIVDAAKSIPAAVGKIGTYAGPAVIAGVEIITYGKTIYDAYQNKSKGYIDKREFINIAVGNAGKGAIRGGLAVAGAAIGQMLVPVPIVGALIGGTLGALLGQGLGMLFNWGFSKLRSKKLK